MAKIVTVAKLVQKFNAMGKMVHQKINQSSEKHANGFIKKFQEKLSNGDFSPRLKPDTVKQKRRKGTPLPSTPLYRWGERSKNSMYNGLKAKSNGWGKWEVKPFGIHRDRDRKQTIRMQDLFAIHEYGASLKNGGKIPARKPLQRTKEAYIKSVEYAEANKQTTSAIIKAK